MKAVHDLIEIWQWYLLGPAANALCRSLIDKCSGYGEQAKGVSLSVAVMEASG